MTTTKSLSELTNDILKSKISAAQKCQALIKLGVTPYEAQFLARASMPAVVHTPRHTFSFTFGVEIECVGCIYNDFFNAARGNGLEVYTNVSYNHVDRQVFKLVTDGSIVGSNPAECVTPPLNNNANGFKALERCCQSLAQIGASANSSCGLHVHIGAASLTDKEYCNVFVNYMMLEEAINSFLAPSRRDLSSRWCKSLRNHMTAVLQADTKSAMREALNFDRYHRVNAEAYGSHTTIEFRQHQGSTNFTKIQNWVKFLGKLVEYSKTHRLDYFVNTIEEIPFLTKKEKEYFVNRRSSFEARVA